MLTLPPSTKIFIARETIDMRKSLSGLSVVVRSVLQQDPMSGYLFVFLGRTRTIVKALYWPPVSAKLSPWPRGPDCQPPWGENVN